MGLFFQEYRETFVMEDLSKRWQKLSLIDTEGDKFDLSKKKQIPEFILAGKFFTRRAKNIDASKNVPTLMENTMKFRDKGSGR